MAYPQSLGLGHGGCSRIMHDSGERGEAEQGDFPRWELELLGSTRSLQSTTAIHLPVILTAAD